MVEAYWLTIRVRTREASVLAGVVTMVFESFVTMVFVMFESFCVERGAFWLFIPNFLLFFLLYFDKCADNIVKERSHCDQHSYNHW